MKHFNSLQKSGYLNIMFQVLFLIACFALGKAIVMDFNSKLGMVLLILIILLPSIIWTIFFYLQDRVEPEPLSFLILAFFLGVSVAELIGIPVKYYLFDVSKWIYSSNIILLLASIFITGTLTSFLIYLVLRYVFYPSREFDEPVDGMVYGAFIGAGYAFIESFYYLSRHPDFTLFNVAYVASANVLLYAGVSSLVGLFMGKAKFEGKNLQLNILYGIILSSFIIGFYHYINEIIFIKGHEHSILISIIFTTCLSLAILIISLYWMRRLTSKDLHRDIKIPFSLDYLVVLIFFVFIIIGVIIKSNADNYRKFESREYNFKLEYPNIFNSFNAISSVNLNSLSLPDSTNSFSTLLNVENEKNMVFMVRVKKETVQLDNLHFADFLNETDPQSYAEEPILINGKKAMRIKHSFIRKSKSELIEQGFPSLIWSYTDIIPAGSHTIILDFSAPSGSFSNGIKIYECILKTLKF